jgi:hypothetical protein
MAYPLCKAVRIAFVLPLALPVLADNTLTAEGSIAKSTYCSVPNGHIDLWVNFTVKYRNRLGSPVILATPNLVRGYKLFRDAEDVALNRPVRKFVSASSEMFEPSKMDHSKPDPALFEIVQPEGVAHRIHNVQLLVSGPGVHRLESGDYYLQVSIDTWPADRSFGESLARSWERWGKLWLNPITLPPMRLQVEKAPGIRPCPLRVD